MAFVQTLSSLANSSHERLPAHHATGTRPEPAAWQPLSAIREWVGVVLVSLLIFSILLAIAGFVASYDGRRESAAFQSDGRSVVGTISDKHARTGEQAYWTTVYRGGATDQLYQLSVCFRVQGGGDHCGTVGVPNTTFDGVRIGSPLRVTYVPWHPDWFYLGDSPPDDLVSDVFTRMFHFGTIAGLLLIIAMAAIVFWPQHEGGGGSAASGSPANDVAHRFRQRHGYGKNR